MEEKKLSPLEKDVQAIELFLSEKNPENNIVRRLEPEMEVLRHGLEIDAYNVEKALLAYRTACCIETYNRLVYQHKLSGEKDKALGKKLQFLVDAIEEQKARLETFFKPLRSDITVTGQLAYQSDLEKDFMKGMNNARK